MKISRVFYQLWVWGWFAVMFIIIYPLFLLFSLRDSWKKYGHFCNKIWAYVVFGTCLVPTKVEFRFKPNKKQPYVYCPNHTSFMDIPSLCYALPGYFLFIGKASLAKVPFFGYMFRNYYIPVDRNSKKSKYDTMQKAFQAIDKGRSIAIFPEGTIPKDIAPNLISFKDGPFRMAIEKQVPLVPVTIPFNWIILPDDGKFFPERHLMKVIVHEAIDTKGLTIDDVPDLKNKTYQIIREELNKQLIAAGMKGLTEVNEELGIV